MNQGMYDLMVRELEASRKAWDTMMAEQALELERMLMAGNGTLREVTEREFRDKL